MSVARTVAQCRGLIVLFDLDGVLLRHDRVLTGVGCLKELATFATLGIFSSKQPHNVKRYVKRLPKVFHPDLIFDRERTVSKPGLNGSTFDTVKPLRRLFTKHHMHRVLMVDDDIWKAVKGERRNFVWFPSTNDPDMTEARSNRCLRRLTEELKRIGDNPVVDVRDHTQSISDAIYHTK